jgi:Fic-DOC domain mobile mystery protein B
MGLTLVYEEGQTPIDEDEKDGLLIKSITTREELDEFEQNNIQQALLWLFTKRITSKNILTEDFILNLHFKMFGEVWKWAGQFRNTNKNIGVDKYEIAQNLRILLDDCRFWIEHKTYSDDEAALRFKHRLVSIHCFANGNGRHSRLIADVISERIFGGKVFSWGGNDLAKKSAARANYLRAVKAADAGNISLLLEFART